MIKIENNLTIDSLWLQGSDVTGGKWVTILNAGRRNPKEETGLKDDTFEIDINLDNGEKRTWTMNKTSQRAVARHLGMDTNKWLNRKIYLHTIEQNVKGELKPCVYVKFTDANIPADFPAVEKVKDNEDITQGTAQAKL